MKIGKRIFTATYNVNSETTTIHGKRNEKGEGRFFITKILKDARVWKEINIDKMCAESPILWKPLDVSVLQKVTIPLQGTESTYPTVVQTKKVKQKESEWQINVKKAKLSSGEGYEIRGKRKGKNVKKSKVHLKPACPDTCRLRFSEIFND